MMDKQIALILDAALAGCNTTRDLSDELGLPIGVCSAHVSELVAAGCLKHNGKTIIEPTGKKGWKSRFKVFEPTTRGKQIGI